MDLGNAINNIDWRKTLFYGGVGMGLGAALGTVGSAAYLAAPYASSAFSVGAKWLAAHPVVSGGLIGGELEWARQASTNLSRGMDIFHAGYRENLDGWKIAKSAAFGAITAGIWDKAGVFSTFANEGMAGLVASKMTQSVAAATLWGGIISGGSYAFSLWAYNVYVRNNIEYPLDGFTWGDFFSSAAAGSLMNWLSARWGIYNSPKFSLNQNVNTVAKAAGYLVIGPSVSLSQAFVGSIFDSLGNKGIPPNAECIIGITGVGGSFNIFSLIGNPQAYALINFATGAASGIRANYCPTDGRNW